MQETWDAGSNPGLGWSPCRTAWQPTPVFLPGEPLGQRATVHDIAKSGTWLKQLSTHEQESNKNLSTEGKNKSYSDIMIHRICLPKNYFFLLNINIICYEIETNPLKLKITRRNSWITPYPLSQKRNCKNLSVLHAQQCSFTSNEFYYFPLRLVILFNNK